MREILSLLVLLIVLTACSGSDSDHGIRISEVDATQSGQHLDVQLVQELRLSRPALVALRHGVPLTVRASWELRAANSRRPIAQAQEQWEIRYLPLSQHYQLVGPGETRTFPRLRHLLAALARIDAELPSTGTLASGDYTLRTRTWLDRASLPAPMQLPAVLSPDWRHDSKWSTWPLRIDA
jgi:hypothetical protein